jgi:hypothetical protein
VRLRRHMFYLDARHASSLAPEARFDKANGPTRTTCNFRATPKPSYGVYSIMCMVGCVFSQGFTKNPVTATRRFQTLGREGATSLLASGHP